jgi:hypothetical protein
MRTNAKPLKLMTPDERKAYNKDRQKAYRDRCASTPESLAEYRAKRARHTRIRREKLRNDPEKFEAHLARNRERDRLRKKMKRASTQLSASL